MFITLLILYVAVCVSLGVYVARQLKRRWAKIVAVCVPLVLMSLFFVQRLFVGLVPEWVNRVVYVVGTMWIAAVLYFVILMLIVLLARLVARLSGRELKPFGLRGMAGIGILVLITLVAGHVVAVSPKLTHYDLEATDLGGRDSLRVAVVSDLHMGYAIGQDDIAKMVDIINAQQPDLCILAGDLFDGDPNPVLAGDIGRPLAQIDCPLGTYAVMGNHEYIGNPDVAARYIRSLGLTLLRDSAAQPAEWLTIVGRDDLSSQRATGHPRRPLDQLMPASGGSVIVVDHQPGAIDEAAQCRADVSISGHTHGGQLWPMRFFTHKIYNHDYGHRRFGTTEAVVTSGYGTWGPRARLGSIAEVVVLTIRPGR